MLEEDNSAIYTETATSIDPDSQMNYDNALADMTVEPTVNLDSFTEQTSPVLAPTYTNEPSSSIASQVGTSSDNVQTCRSTRPSQPSESDFPFGNNY